MRLHLTGRISIIAAAVVISGHAAAEPLYVPTMHVFETV